MEQTDKKRFYRELFSLAVPIGVQNLLIALIGATDALMLGRLAQDAVAAVSLANQVAFVMNLFIGALVGGGGVLLAQYWGKGDRRMVQNLFCTVLKGAVGIALVFFLLALLAPEALMRVYTPDPALIAIGASYLRAVAPSYLFVGATQCCYLVMKLEGRARTCVAISVAALGLDMLLDLFLIYGLAGAPRLGADGSAWSTLAVELLALLWCVVQARQKGGIRPDREGLRWFSRDVMRDMGRVCLPMLASSLAWGLGFSLHSLLMGHLGSDAAAAAAIAAVAQELVGCACKGLSAGAGIMVGKVLGQGQFSRAREYGRRFCYLSFWAGGANMLLLWALTPALSAFFLLTEAARHCLVQMLLFNGLYLFAFSINTIVVCGVFPAGGDARYDAVSVLFASWCFALPLAFLAAFVFHWPPIVVYMLMCADEIVKVPFIYPHYKKYIWVRDLTRAEA